MAQTKLANVINTQVMAQAVESQLGNAIKLYPTAFVQSFEGQNAGKIAVPSYNFIGSAPIVAEGVAIDPTLLTQASADLDIVKVAKAIEITDEARKSAFGDVLSEAENQLVASLSAGIETQLVTALATAPLGFSTEVGVGLTSAGILAGMALFGEAYAEGQQYLVINPTELSSVRLDNNFSDGQIFDLNLVVSNNITAGTAYIVKQGALGLYLAKGVDVETDRDILAKTTVLSGSVHFASHLRDESKAVKITIA